MSRKQKTKSNQLARFEKQQQAVDEIHLQGILDRKDQYGKFYLEVVDQTAHTQLLDIDRAYAHDSDRKFRRPITVNSTDGIVTVKFGTKNNDLKQELEQLIGEDVNLVFTHSDYEFKGYTGYYYRVMSLMN